MSSILWLLMVYVFQRDIRNVLYIMTVEGICHSREYKTCLLYYDCWRYVFQGDIRRHVLYIMTVEGICHSRGYKTCPLYYDCWRYMSFKGIKDMSSTLWLLKIYVIQRYIRNVLYIMTVEGICHSRGYKTCPLHYDCWRYMSFKGI